MSRIFSYYNATPDETTLLEETWDLQEYLRLARAVPQLHAKLMMMISSKNALLVEYHNDYKIVDFSI
jgi:hypothetical protein